MTTIVRRPFKQCLNDPIVKDVASVFLTPLDEREFVLERVSETVWFGVF